MKLCETDKRYSVIIALSNYFERKDKTMSNTITIEEQAKKSRAEYQREWRKKNKDKLKQYNINYWLKKAKEQLAEEQAVYDAE